MKNSNNFDPKASKFGKCIAGSREAIIRAVKNIDEFDSRHQHGILKQLNRTLRELDTISTYLARMEDPNAPVINTQKMLSNQVDMDKQMGEIWNDMNEAEIQDYKLMVLRMAPEEYKGHKINGYIKTFHLPTTIPDIMEEIGLDYGGGKYQIRIVDGSGKYIKSKKFDVSGEPRIPSLVSDTKS